MFERQIPRVLQTIHDKVLEGIRLSDADALTLYTTADLHTLGALASSVRERKNGRTATYVFNRYLNYSNLCLLSCQFCAFGAKQREPHAFEMAAPEIVALAQAAAQQGVTEIHMVGGLHPSLPAQWYLDLLQALRAIQPALHLKCFTAIEIRHLARRVFKRSIRETLEALRAAGLDSLTGGGAEIFDPEVRAKICRGKETADEWLEVHRTWHAMGGRSTCTMLFGHLETPAHRVDHLRRLRALQDETGGFVTFVPFAFEPQNARPELRHLRPASALEQLRNLAVCRLYLDNFDHLTAYWVSLGLPLAGVALNYGADDLHGTIFEEKIFHMAGVQTPQQQTVAALERAIREAGLEPRQRDSLFAHLPRAIGETAPLAVLSS